jgi:hypothetical protein
MFGWSVSRLKTQKVAKSDWANLFHQWSNFIIM